MEVLTMRLHTAIPVLLVLTTFLCACQKTSSQNETDSKAELVTSTASTTSIATATSTSIASTATEPMNPIVQSEFKLVQPQLSLEKNRSVYALEHYFSLLEKKGRAIFYARPVLDSLPAYFLK